MQINLYFRVSQNVLQLVVLKYERKKQTINYKLYQKSKLVRCLEEEKRMQGIVQAVFLQFRSF